MTMLTPKKLGHLRKNSNHFHDTLQTSVVRLSGQTDLVRLLFSGRDEVHDRAKLAVSTSRHTPIGSNEFGMFAQIIVVHRPYHSDRHPLGL